MNDNPENGVIINLISNRKLDSMNSQEKIRFIIDEIKRGTVLILERGLTAEEEINLIKTTMSEINHQTFIGIEMQSYSAQDLAADSWINKLLGRTRVPRMSVIGPSKSVKTIYKNGNIIQAMILTGESIVDNLPKEDKREPGAEAEIDAIDLEARADVEGETTTRSEPGPTEPPAGVGEPEHEPFETIPSPEYTPEQQADTASSEYYGPPTTSIEPLPPEGPTSIDSAQLPAVPAQPGPPLPPMEQTQAQPPPPEQQPTNEYQAQEQTRIEPPPEQQPTNEYQAQEQTGSSHHQSSSQQTSLPPCKKVKYPDFCIKD